MGGCGGVDFYVSGCVCVMGVFDGENDVGDVEWRDVYDGVV